MIRMRGLGLVLAACLGLAAPVSAEVKLPSIFSNSMVLQRDKPIAVWGWDNPGTEVTVSLGESKTAAKADDQGKWSASLPAQKANATGQTLTVKGSSEKAFTDVLVGEVWLCSGQSNMEWTVNISAYPAEERLNGDHPLIRHIKIPQRPSAKPEADVPTKGWEVATPKTVGNFTAVGYFFALNLRKDKEFANVPVGLIGSNWGGTRIEPWTTPEGFKSVPALKDIADKLDTFPTKDDKGNINMQTPLALYYGMISPLVPYGIRGALWYQGESNNGEGMLYTEKMWALINGWRKLWNDENMPFYFVQIAPYRYKSTGLPFLWEAQMAALKIPGTGMAQTTDISNINDIHPNNKQEVGRRLANIALAKTYGKQGLALNGPIFKAMKLEGGKARISFDGAENGLNTRFGAAVSHFTVAGADKKFVPAKAVIEGNEVVLSAEGVSEIAAVRFAWDELAEPSLVNKEGLPAYPFRTDDWK
jgi:sialate O-acetylesterase